METNNESIINFVNDPTKDAQVDENIKISQQIYNNLEHKFKPISTLLPIIKCKNNVGLISYLDLVVSPPTKNITVGKWGQDNIDVGNMSQFQIEVKTLPISLELRTTKCKFNQGIIDDLKKYHNIDANLEIIDQSTNDIALQLWRDYKNKLNQISQPSYFSNQLNWFDKIKKFVFKLIKKEYNKYYKVTDSTSLLRKIMVESNKLMVANRRTPGTHVICSQAMTSYLFDSTLSFQRSSNNTIEACPIFENFGNNGHITIIVDYTMKWNDGTIYICAVPREKNMIEGNMTLYISELNNGILDYINESTMKKEKQIYVKSKIADTPISSKFSTILNCKIPKENF